jgi:hypothetical protein
MITSFFPGRVRLRAPIFKEADLVAKARAILQKSVAVKNIEHNPVTGSVLIEYEPSKVPMETLLPMQDFFTRLANKAQHFDGSEKRRTEIIEMLSALEDLL